MSLPLSLIVAVAGIVVLAALVTLLALRLRWTRRAVRADEGITAAIVSAAVDGIITIDERGRMLSFNPAAERLFGYSTAEVLNRNVSMLMPEPYRSQHDGYLHNYRSTGAPKIIGIGREVTGRRKDGSVFPMELAVGKSPDPGPRLFAGIVRDITARKQAEEELRTAKDQAERAILAQSKFLAAASHDLRQPVQALTLFASALAAKITGAPASALLDDMRGSLEALNMLLDSLLDVSRLDAGTIIPHETTFSVAAVLERLVTEFTPQADDKQIAFSSVPSSALVRTDPTLLYRVIQNFLSNAVRYTSQGRVLIGCRRYGRKLRIEVLDTGVGIPEPLQQEIFKEFFQVGNLERDRTKGLGLGLAIVQRLGTLLRCRVTVKSKEGRGSAFGIEVPLVGFNKATNVVVLRPDAPKPALTGKGLVFVIDDEPTVLKGLRLVIDGWGYTVLTARTELEAIQTLTTRQQAPDLIIADYRLRGICTGAQVITHIRQVFGRQIPGILITGDTAPERIREASDHGLTLLHKPVAPPELLTAIMAKLAGAADPARNAGA